MSQWISIVLVVWPIIVKLARLKGIELPDLGEHGSMISQSVGTGILAFSDPLGKKKA